VSVVTPALTFNLFPSTKKTSLVAGTYE
jgi:hypothetical protein